MTYITDEYIVVIADKLALIFLKAKSFTFVKVARRFFSVLLNGRRFAFLDHFIHWKRRLLYDGAIILQRLPSVG